ncbi:NADH-quinone oxidoreductase subunit L [Paucibacter sp. DJ2R-2]|uniref:NADH-quinone oxidoreductase subunit L n=1 Tax=Paucibacter sp. DJ2R-2 TaxID=2893558 RepID=UPI0021E44B79|nr:NADH-quinone oxidoreductase subunit L [Paucibacter sp. DJ2R-2]MCV2422996.1 NADH-quinone oxidoreductase subunit L [Paucibacter sp. DJ4R-1]MCV2440892.1 NADH-quinone oxidoreductase subunit L [Paucibacter sp. DJ2R-2]
MTLSLLVFAAGALAPLLLMLLAALLPRLSGLPDAGLWRVFHGLSVTALFGSGLALALGPQVLPLALLPWVQASPLALGLALLVQLLGTVIAGFSARYLEGEAGQRRYVAALAAVLAGVHLLLLADHWLVLIAAWALVGMALQPLLCFYPERPFARLAAHKKRIADRLADALLIVAAALAWTEVGSGSLSALWAHLEGEGMSGALQISAVSLVLAVILRTALLPVHGWLIQVMEAPTPVSALLHAGVVNLGGFVLIRFAPLLEQAATARVLLLVFGLGTAVLAGMVMLTRISIKVRLAWSTVAQMGFMLLECGLGLYTLAALHLVGHSLYKAHAFLSASSVLRQTRLQALHGLRSPSAPSLLLAPALALGVVLLTQALAQALSGGAAWPIWWSAVLGLAWAPLLWLPSLQAGFRALAQQALSGVLMVAGLSGVALLAHALPLGITDRPHDTLGWIALAGMLTLYLGLALLQLRPQALRSWRRWSYAGFYVDEAYTRLALQLWPSAWAPEHAKPAVFPLRPEPARLGA